MVKVICSIIFDLLYMARMLIGAGRIWWAYGESETVLRVVFFNTKIKYKNIFLSSIKTSRLYIIFYISSLLYRKFCNKYILHGFLIKFVLRWLGCLASSQVLFLDPCHRAPRMIMAGKWSQIRIFLPLDKKESRAAKGSLAALGRPCGSCGLKAAHVLLIMI